MGTPITTEDILGERSPEGGGAQGSFLDTLADELAGSVGSVFGAPVEREGVTVIPVAKARWGMGGGFGPARRGEREEGRESAREPSVGGGGGALVKPLGFIELAGGRTRFRAIRDPGLTALAVIAGGFLGLSALRAIVGEHKLGARGVRLTRRRRRARRLRKLLA